MVGGECTLYGIQFSHVVTLMLYLGKGIDEETHDGAKHADRVEEDLLA